MRALFALLLWIAAATAAAQAPVEGKQYRELRPPLAAPAGDRVEVVEFFYYGCPVCYEAQPQLARWLAGPGKDVALRRVPAVFTESSESFARTFFTLEAMNEVARLHWPLYDNHHFDGRQLNEYKNVVSWVAANGVDRARFEALWKSDAVSAQVAEAKKTVAAYHVSGVPSLVVDGKYLTSAKMAGGTREMLGVLDYLVRRAGAERRK
jgi:thiol:disulfide interchange protein DsbA